ncbi:MAG: ArnT family glycosyltransferase [Acidiferrobacteraceae bacterium]
MSLTSEISSLTRRQALVDGSGIIKSRQFGVALTAIVILGIVARIFFVLGWTVGAPLHGDPLFFQQSAARIANGQGYVDRFLGKGALVPTAEHPPVFSFVLAGLDLLHLRSVDAHRVALAFISAAGVLVMGLFGRRLTSPGVGLLAAGIAAVDPLWIQQGGFLMSESVYLVVVPLMLLIALRCIDRHNRVDFVAFGVIIGVATLTRSEAIEFVVLLGAPVVVFAAYRWRQRGTLALMLLAGLGIVFVPWLIRNDVELGALTLSTNGGLTLAGSYSAATFSPKSPVYGGFDNNSQFGTAAVIVAYENPPNHARHWTELTLSNAMSHSAISYALKHLSDLPGVLAAREGRVWGVYAPGAELNFDVAEDGTGARGPKQVGQIMNWVLLPFCLIGAVWLARRSRKRMIIVAAPILAVAITAAAFYGSTRLRVAAIPSIAVLASIGALSVIAGVRTRANWLGAQLREGDGSDPTVASPTR